MDTSVLSLNPISPIVCPVRFTFFVHSSRFHNPNKSPSHCMHMCIFVGSFACRYLSFCSTLLPWLCNFPFLCSTSPYPRLRRSSPRLVPPCDHHHQDFSALLYSCDARYPRSLSLAFSPTTSAFARPHIEHLPVHIIPPVTTSRLCKPFPRFHLSLSLGTIPHYNFQVNRVHIRWGVEWTGIYGMWLDRKPSHLTYWRVVIHLPVSPEDQSI
jgi:hypothetical protein